MTNLDVINHFLSAQKAKNQSGSLTTDGVNLFSYSTLVAYHDHVAEMIIVSQDNFSPTTGKQLSLLANQSPVELIYIDSFEYGITTRPDVQTNIMSLLIQHSKLVKLASRAKNHKDSYLLQASRLTTQLDNYSTAHRLEV